MPNQAFIIERTYNAQASKVWQAITDPAQMKQWYFDLPGFKAESGYQFQFYGGTEENQYLHLCEVTEVVAGKKLTYSWRYDGYAGNSFVTWELFPEGDKTRLLLTHAGLDTFPAEQPDFAAKNFELGWTEILGTSLKAFVE
jgi:uncharacterized protein YndB with AHSA1/START domain